MLDSDRVAAVAKLAKLNVDEAETQALAADMAAILQLVDHIGEADTAGVAPLSNPHDRTATLRPDTVTEADQRERFQAIAPATADGLYLVPRVVE